MSEIIAPADIQLILATTRSIYNELRKAVGAENIDPPADVWAAIATIVAECCPINPEIPAADKVEMAMAIEWEPIS